MNTATPKSILSHLESAASGVREVQSKFQELLTALHAVQEFIPTVEQAAARQDIAWLANVPQHWAEATQRLRSAIAEAEALLKE